MSLPENETMINLKSASFMVIMLLHEGLTHVHSQIKPRLLFEFHFNCDQLLVILAEQTGKRETMSDSDVTIH